MDSKVYLAFLIEIPSGSEKSAASENETQDLDAYGLADILRYKSLSFSFLESDDVSVFSETFSAEQKVVFTNKTHLACATAALAAVLSVFSRVGSPEKVWHSCGYM